ncbi:NAD(P)-binding protein [Russula earlei]|uniref:NAD(P)-binding protein n=1 Tax=Russula earlei TaxID=71964 RepID=A0ACC0TRF0_9AGAM|nr:NAD(P)-binding protein [Russula earlei]
MPRRIGIFSQLVPPGPTWTSEKIGDQTGKVVIITDGYRGIGKETARVLLSHGARVYIATQSATKAQKAIDDLKIDSQKEAVFHLPLDLGDLDSIEAAAKEFLRIETELHTLYNNGGATYGPVDRETAQRYDLPFGTNVLGHFYFTKLLLPVLKATAVKSPRGSVRVINVTSIAHYMAPAEGIRWSTVNNGDGAPDARKKLGMGRLYAQSKLGTILFSNELARKHGDDGIVSISLFPGALNANVAGNAGNFFIRIYQMLGALVCFVVTGGNLEDLTDEVRRTGETTADNMQRNLNDRVSERVNTLQNMDPLDAVASIRDSDVAKSSYLALTSLYAGTEPTAGTLNGKYLAPWARPSLPHRRALDIDLARKLWDWCEEQVRDRCAKANDAKDKDGKEKDARAEDKDVKGESSKDKDVEVEDVKGESSKDRDVKVEDVKVEGVKVEEVKDTTDKDAKDEDTKAGDVKGDDAKDKA